MSKAKIPHETDKQVQLATSFMLASCLSYSSILKMEITCYSETPVDFLRNTRRYIPEKNSS
jgi:hypothetical protein